MSKVVTYGEARVELYPRTVFTRKMWLGILKVIGEFIFGLAEELGYPEKIVDDVANDFAYVSSRVKSCSGVPFEFLAYEDSADTCKKKLMAYFEAGIDHKELMGEITKTINEMDAVTSPGGLSPTAPKASTPSADTGKKGRSKTS